MLTLIALRSGWMVDSSRPSRKSWAPSISDQPTVCDYDGERSISDKGRGRSRPLYPKHHVGLHAKTAILVGGYLLTYQAIKAESKWDMSHLLSPQDFLISV